MKICTVEFVFQTEHACALNKCFQERGWQNGVEGFARKVAQVRECSRSSWACQICLPAGMHSAAEMVLKTESVVVAWNTMTGMPIDMQGGAEPSRVWKS